VRIRITADCLSIEWPSLQWVEWLIHGHADGNRVRISVHPGLILSLSLWFPPLVSTWFHLENTWRVLNNPVIWLSPQGGWSSWPGLWPLHWIFQTSFDDWNKCVASIQNLLQNYFTQVQSALCHQAFCFHRFNQVQIENIFLKMVSVLNMYRLSFFLVFSS
jgi:hypothetical protein